MLGVRGYFRKRERQGCLLSVSSLLFDGCVGVGVSVCVCVCICPHTHTHCTWGTWM